MAFPALALPIMGASIGAATGAGGIAAAGGAAGMSPILQKLLGDAAGGILGGIGSGLSQSRKGRKQQELMEQRGEFFSKELKPEGEYYQTFKNLPQYDWLAKSLVLGNLEEQLGADLLSKWGIDLNDFKGETGLTQPGGIDAMKYFGNTRVPTGQLPTPTRGTQRTIGAGSLGGG